MQETQNITVVDQYLDLMDAQREQVFNAIAGISHEALWQRPESGEWCIGEILHHNIRLYQSVFPFASIAWRFFRWTGKLLQSRTYRTTIEDPYRKDSFPHWAGFLWKPKYTLDHTVSLEKLLTETKAVHQTVRRFYEGKQEAMLGNVFLFDPLFGFINLILVLRIGVYHDQLHYDDVIKMMHGKQ